jgi:large repetitive protein
METRRPIRLLSVLAVLAALLLTAAPALAAAPLPPVPISPAGSSTIAIPTFTWQPSVGAAKYEVEVGPQSDPNTVLWTAQTLNLSLTPNNAAVFTNAPLYWRVRAKDGADVAGAWSGKINFTKAIAAPALVSPTNGSAAVMAPTFQWLAVPEAAYYKVELSTAANFLVVEATYTTFNTRTTPVATLAHGTHYWRVSGVDADGHVGTPSTGWSFTKGIAAPVLVSPTNGSGGVVIPTLQWTGTPEAAYYKVELSTSPTFLVVEATYTTYDTRTTPVDTLPHGLHYWRVSGVDADGHVGTPSAGWSFTKVIPAPVLVSPYNTHPNVHIPTMEWQAAAGAAYYQVELSASATFVPLEATYITYNTRTTPVDTFVHGLHYWRVSGVDAGGHVGTPSAGWSFTKSTDAPVLVSPGVNETLTIPTFQWQAVDGAAYYRVELSTEATFVPVTATFTTYNLRTTPVAALASGTYYWRVSGVDAGGNVGGNNWRRFTLAAPPAATDVAPALATPADTEAIATDPTFSWSRSVGADHYTLVVSSDAGFGTTYDSVTTDYSSYTPNSVDSPDAYPNGTYYWKVEARNSGGTVIATSLARSFTKTELLPLLTPTDGATGLTVDPTFAWSQIVGAHHYQLIVSQNSGFSTTYDSVFTDYNSYTPNAVNSPDSYPNGTYYWKVEGRTSAGTVIATSEARSLTKSEPQPLVAPADGATGLVVDPTFQWTQIVGADHYQLLVSTSPAFSTTYDSVFTDYTEYTPNTVDSPDAYPNGTYYWKVEARTSAGTVIATSAARSLTKLETLPLIAPADGATGLLVDPTFEWTRIVGAHHYHLVISTNPGFSTTFDDILTDYTSYTPNSVDSPDAYPNGTYYWKVEARTSAGILLATSAARSFTKGEPVPLTAPANGARSLIAGPTFEWLPIVGAHHYRLTLSTNAGFATTYETLLSDYPRYTPFSPAGKSGFADGLYYWKVDAVTSAGITIATSTARTLTVMTKRAHLPVVNRQ